jgi:hypothetical protein
VTSGHTAGQQAQAGAPQHVVVLLRDEQQAMRRRQIVTGLLAHGRGDLILSRRRP